MVSDDQETVEMCNKVHSIMQDATKDLPIPDPNKARDSRKKISVFTYGVISELTATHKVYKDKVYEKYLIMGGLSHDQADSIVRRTRDEFAQQEFGEKCLSSGRKAVIQWQSGDKNIKSLLEALL